MTFIYGVLEEVQQFSLLCLQAIWNLFRRPRYSRDTLAQMDSVGVASLPIVTLSSFFTGGVMALQTANSLESFGATNVTGQLVAVSLVRELGPILTALMVAGRVGSGMASQLGSMVVTEQIDAMRALGTDPSKKLVTPRMLACTTMTPLLTVAADIAGLAGGWIVAYHKLQLNTALYWSSALRSLDYADALAGLLKPIVFGFIIGMVACYCGLRTKGGTIGVGRSTTMSVVTSSCLVLVSDFFLTKIILDLSY